MQVIDEIMKSYTHGSSESTQSQSLILIQKSISSL